VKGGNTDMEAVFGGGKSAAPAGPSLRAAADEAYSDEPAEGEGEAEMPAEFATHAEEAGFTGDKARALYRAIQSCH
jgi:hypothetical protein